MDAQHILLPWASGFVTALVGMGIVTKPANRDGWLVVAALAAAWPVTLLIFLTAYLFKEPHQ